MAELSPEELLLLAKRISHSASSTEVGGPCEITVTFDEKLALGVALQEKAARQQQAAADKQTCRFWQEGTQSECGMSKQVHSMLTAEPHKFTERINPDEWTIGGANAVLVGRDAARYDVLCPANGRFEPCTVSDRDHLHTLMSRRVKREVPR